MNIHREQLDNPRAEIDLIDREIVHLLNQRASVALRVGETKSEREASLCDPGREQDVIANAGRANEGPLDDQSIANIFGRIIDESLYLQQIRFRSRSKTNAVKTGSGHKLIANARVGYLGEHGTFSEQAALSIMGESCSAVSFATFDELFASIKAGTSDYVVAPIENSLIGSVRRCVDLLLASSLHIIGEVVLPVSHCLIGPADATIDTIRSVESHPAALAQCERFFAAHPDLERIPANDTAGSVKRVVAGNDPSLAAIGSKRAAEVYGGHILREQIEDHTQNFTRFVLLSSEIQKIPSGDKVSLIVRLKNEPGALHDALRPFVRRGIDLLKIESLPIREGPDEFNFYLDLTTPSVKADLDGAIDEIKKRAKSIRFLGQYSTTKLV